MKMHRLLPMLIAAGLISYNARAQSATSPPAPTQTNNGPPPTNAPASQSTPPEETGYGFSKPKNDKINATMKGSNGQVVYTNKRGSNYYITKSGDKMYLKK
jgi:hypothetical protein